MYRIGLFAAANLGVLILLGAVLTFLEPWLASQGMPVHTTGILIFAAVFGFGGALVSLALSKWTAKTFMRVRVIDEPTTRTERWLVNTVRDQAERAGIGMPEVGIYEAADLNAFATGMQRNDALVAVSTGLLEGMTADEVEAVLAHEVTHVANGDMVTMALLQGVMNTFVLVFSRLIGFVIDRFVFRNERGYGPGFFVGMIVAQIVLGVLAQIVVMGFSRRREFRADAGGADLAGRQAMIAALRRLAGAKQPLDMPEQMEAMGISGREGMGWRRLLLSHPPIPERIKVLQEPG
jgi:heat shock protein HtpX